MVTNILHYVVESISNSLFSYLFRVDNPVDHYLAYCIIQNLFHGTLIIISKFQKKRKNRSEEKTGNYQSSGGVPRIGKRPIYFRFFLLKASLSLIYLLAGDWLGNALINWKYSQPSFSALASQKDKWRAEKISLEGWLVEK